jgi:hypothetical protein
MLSNLESDCSGALYYETARFTVRDVIEDKNNKTHKAEFSWLFLFRQRHELGINVITREPSSSTFQFSIPPSTRISVMYLDYLTCSKGKTS